MKTSIFDMALTLPPMVEMTQVEKDMDAKRTGSDTSGCGCLWDCWPFKETQVHKMFRRPT